MISNPTLAAITFQYADVRVAFAKKNNLKKTVAQIFTDYGRPLASATYIFCSDEFLLDINQRFLQHDDFTDIITFNLAPHRTAPAEGEIYISIDRVRENAKHYRVKVQLECARVIFHGALHLCGLKDKTRKDSATMRKQEDHYLKIFVAQE